MSRSNQIRKNLLCSGSSQSKRYVEIHAYIFIMGEVLDRYCVIGASYLERGLIKLFFLTLSMTRMCLYL